MSDTERLDWLLDLIWETGHRDNEAASALDRFKRLRRRLHNACFPFRDAIDESIREEQTNVR